MNKRAQVTLFIILAIVIVASLLFFFFSDKFNSDSINTNNPQSFFDKCIKDSIRESENTLLNSNGFTKVEDNFILYNKEKIPYLCTTSEFYTSCTPQEPAFLSSIQTIMENKVSRDTENCLVSFTKDMESKGYQLTKEKSNVTLTIRKGEISVEMGKPIFLKKDETSTEIPPIKVYYSSSLFDLVKTAQTIVNYESSLCEFDLLNWQKYENQIQIARFRTSDQTKIYTLTDRNSEKQIKFAIKTCVMPAGI